MRAKVQKTNPDKAWAIGVWVQRREFSTGSEEFDLTSNDPCTVFAQLGHTAQDFTRLGWPPHGFTPWKEERARGHEGSGGKDHCAQPPRGCSSRQGPAPCASQTALSQKSFSLEVISSDKCTEWRQSDVTETGVDTWESPSETDEVARVTSQRNR